MNTMITAKEATR